MNPKLALLTLCQGLFLVNNVTFIAINGLVGLALAPVGWMATLPVTGYVAGGALAQPLVARHQQRYGRQRSFMLGLAVAAATTLLCALAVSLKSFWLLLLGTVLAGYYNASAGLYRFAAAELVPATQKERAISWVLAGGLLGAVVGPNLASATRGLLVQPFAGAYLALAAVALLSMAVMWRIPFPDLPGQGGAPATTGRPLGEIVRQPLFIVAAACCAIGYGVMNLLMAATPIAMQQCALPFSAAAWVLQWHVVAMFAPSFFTGSLIKRVGLMPVLAAGLALNVLCVAVALSGQDLAHFTWALVALGLGWNFLFVGGTTLATESWRPEEKTRAQAALDFTVMVVMTLTSFSSGALVTTGGWQAMNLGSGVPLAVLAGMLLWLAALRGRAQNRPV